MKPVKVEIIDYNGWDEGIVVNIDEKILGPMNNVIFTSILELSKIYKKQIDIGKKAIWGNHPPVFKITEVKG